MCKSVYAIWQFSGADMAIFLASMLLEGLKNCRKMAPTICVMQIEIR
jgi:hypothetical protein